jgi:transcriptional regulator with XRE-family HTH domain
MERFGDRLRRLRLATGLTPSALAHEVGVTEGAIRQMESGQTKSASLVVGLYLADVLGVDVRYLALGEDASGAPASKGVVSSAERVTALETRIAALEKRVAALEKRSKAR